MRYGRSGIGVLGMLALRIAFTAIGLSLVGMLFYELLISVAGLAMITLIAVMLVRWRIFRWRGW